MPNRTRAATSADPAAIVPSDRPRGRPSRVQPVRHLTTKSDLANTAASALRLQQVRDDVEDARSSPAAVPAGLAARIERLSGVSMTGVRVHHDSDRPARIGALAYAQGNHIHLGPGEDHHLPHEAWHVVQQMRGEVRATTTQHGVAINDDPALERDADGMGRQAAGLTIDPGPSRAAPARPAAQSPHDAPIQRLLNPIRYQTTGDDAVVAQYTGAIGNLVASLNQRVDNAYQQSLQWQALGAHGDPMVRQWYAAASNYAVNPDQEPSVIHARFGYSIEAIACAGLNHSVLHGLTLRTQVAHGHTRPDIVASVGGQEIAWIDITSYASRGHIRGKQGAGWTRQPFVYELVYPQLRLRGLLNAMNDPYYTEYGGLIAEEREIDFKVKQDNRREMSSAFMSFAERNGWETGTDNATNKRLATREMFMTHAVQAGVEDESSSLIATHGALQDLGINPGPYGFNRGGIGASNQRLTEIIALQSADEIEEEQHELHLATTRRIITELRHSRLPAPLLWQAEAEFAMAPRDRDVALYAMLLKGVADDLDRVVAAQGRMAMAASDDGRVPAMRDALNRQVAGPGGIELDAIWLWRRATRALLERAHALEEILTATAALHDYTQQRGITFFDRPASVSNLFNALALDPPRIEAADAARRWIGERLLEEALARLPGAGRNLEAAHAHMTTMMSPADPRVAGLEREIDRHLATAPERATDAINAWIAQAQRLAGRLAHLIAAIDARGALQAYAHERGWNLFTRPAPLNRWFQALDASAPDPAIAQEVMTWLHRERARNGGQ